MCQKATLSLLECTSKPGYQGTFCMEQKKGAILKN